MGGQVQMMFDAITVMAKQAEAQATSARSPPAAARAASRPTSRPSRKQASGIRSDDLARSDGACRHAETDRGQANAEIRRSSAWPRVKAWAKQGAFHAHMTPANSRNTWRKTSRSGQGRQSFRGQGRQSQAISPSMGERFRFTVNGATTEVEASAETPLLYALRNDLQAQSTFSCGSGQCGACFVLSTGIHARLRHARSGPSPEEDHHRGGSGTQGELRASARVP
jgi:ferredoxin